MHLAQQANGHTVVELQPPALKHLWVELTKKCNLECVHCYVIAGPTRPLREGLNRSDWIGLLESAREEGCTSVQFIGGEPLLHPDLEAILRAARTLEYEEIEVFTNATGLTQKWVQLFSDLKVKLALSFYATRAEVHDAITGLNGSYRRTLQAIDRALAADLDMRIGVIQVDQTDKEVEATKQFLIARGVKSVGGDRVRAVGRADRNASFGQPLDQITQLCGACSDGKLCVTSSGETYPCIMARAWPLGNMRDGLRAMLDGAQLAHFRERQSEFLSSDLRTGCGPDSCNPYCRPNCNPYDECSPKCGPSCAPPCGPLCYPK